MNKRTLARLIIQSYDFSQKSQFERVIEFLKTVMFHNNDDTIQNAIWYLEDKERLCKE